MALGRWTSITCAGRKRQQNPPGLTGFSHHSRQQTRGTHCHRVRGCKCFLEGLGKSLNEKIHWKLFNGQKWYPVQGMPWAIPRAKCRGLWKDYTRWLSLSCSSGIQWCCCWKELLGSTDPQSDPVLAFLHPSLSLCAWALRTSFALVGEFHPVSTASHRGATMPLEEKVLSAHILAGDRFESKSASPCWFLGAVRGMSEPLLEQPKKAHLLS